MRQFSSCLLQSDCYLPCEPRNACSTGTFTTAARCASSVSRVQQRFRQSFGNIGGALSRIASPPRVARAVAWCGAHVRQRPRDHVGLRRRFAASDDTERPGRGGPKPSGAIRRLRIQRAIELRAGMRGSKAKRATALRRRGLRLIDGGCEIALEGGVCQQAGRASIRPFGIGARRAAQDASQMAC